MPRSSSPNFDNPPAGFALVNTGLIAGNMDFVGLFLPAHLKATLDAENRTRAKAARAAQGFDDRPSSLKWSSTPKPDLEASAMAAEEKFWKSSAKPATRSRPRDATVVFEPEQAMALWRMQSNLRKDDQPRFERIYAQLRKKGLVRKVSRARTAALQALAHSQPHMAQVVEFILNQLVLSRRSRRPQRLMPILLVGEAGIGKTHFAQKLAEALSAPLSIQRLDTDVTGSFLLGSDRKWSNSNHGLLFEMVVLGDCANPVILLDELDKGDRFEGRPQASLYSLLEPVSARRVRDISVDFEFDASLVTWVATANDAEKLDPPLRSRFKEFHISQPTAEQSLQLAAEVIRETIRAQAIRGFVVETNRLERHLAHLTARQIQQATREALARAVAGGRNHLEVRDLPRHVVGSSGKEPGEMLH